MELCCIKIQTSPDVSREVLPALLALAEYAKTGQAVETCIDANATATICNPWILWQDVIRLRIPQLLHPRHSQMELTQDGELLNLMRISAISYKILGFQKKDLDTNGRWRCLPPSNLYDNIICPLDHFKKSLE